MSYAEAAALGRVASFAEATKSGKRFSAHVGLFAVKEITALEQVSFNYGWYSATDGQGWHLRLKFEPLA